MGIALIHFLLFRKSTDNGEQDQDDEAEIDDEPVAVVGRFFDGHSYKAKMLLSTGDQLMADQYSKGEDGFVVAKWLHDGSEMNLEVANVCLKDDGELKFATTSVAPRPKAIVKKKTCCC